MTRGKAVQEGPRAKLPAGMTWEQLAAMPPEEIKAKNLFPAGFLPLPHPNHPEGGMLFPQFHIDEIKKQDGRDLTRFDLDFDLPEHFLPEFPPPIFLTTRPDLGDVSQGKLVTIDNFYELFNGHPQPEAARGPAAAGHAVPAAAVQRHRRPPLGAAAAAASTCFDCHVNGHTNGATHLVGDIRPQEFRHRIDTPTPARRQHPAAVRLAARAEDASRTSPSSSSGRPTSTATPSSPTKKGVNILERGSQVHFMAEFQELLDFPPAPKLGLDGKLDPAQGRPSRSCAARSCSSARPSARPATRRRTTPTTSMHNLKVERFYKPQTINGH